MKILFLTPQLPFPPDKGATIRTLALIKGLAQRGHEIHLLSLIVSPDDLTWLPQLRPYVAHVETVLAPARTPSMRLRTLLLSRRPDMAMRFPSPEFAAKLADLVESSEFDVVQAESIEMAHFALAVVKQRAAGARRPVVVFDNLNAEYVLQRRAFEVDKGYPRKWARALYSWIQWRRLRAYERQVCMSVDRVLVVSEADKEALTALDPRIQSETIPNGVDCTYFSPGVRPAAYPANLQIQHMASVVFTGTMDFRPNIDGVLWFCHDILPRVKRSIYNVHFYIVGRNPPEDVRALAGPAITVTGHVSDIRPYIANSAVYVVPLRIGSGTRLKILEAMAMRIPVVSTTVGAEGLDVTPDKNILLADAPADFARQVVGLLQDRGQRQKLATNARRMVETTYDWTTIAPALEKVYVQALYSRR